MPQENLSLFSFKATKDEKVMIYYSNKLIMTFSGKKGSALLKKLSSKNEEEQQMILAKLTGNFKRGNERNLNK